MADKEILAAWREEANNAIHYHAETRTNSPKQVHNCPKRILALIDYVEELKYLVDRKYQLVSKSLNSSRIPSGSCSTNLFDATSINLVKPKLGEVE